jgi:hypothetical protein
MVFCPNTNNNIYIFSGRGYVIRPLGISFNQIAEEKKYNFSKL